MLGLQILVHMGTPEKDNRTKIIKRVKMFQDDKSPLQDESQLINDIETPQTFNPLLEEEKQFKQFVKAKINKQKPSDQFLKNLKAHIKSNQS